jgi:hypothetical protein
VSLSGAGLKAYTCLSSSVSLSGAGLNGYTCLSSSVLLLVLSALVEVVLFSIALLGVFSGNGFAIVRFGESRGRVRVSGCLFLL